jgi:hypothetical protein
LKSICFQRALQEEEAAGTYNKIELLTAHNLSSQYFDILTDIYRANISLSPNTSTPINTTGEYKNFKIVKKQNKSLV